MDKLLAFFDKLDSVMYFPILIIVLVAAAIFFTARTRFAQVRLFKEACHLIMEPPQEAGSISSFQALIVSTASRVGTGNIVGVSSAICLGGPGAAFWMWLLALLGSASAFFESTLAQIYKRKNKETGESYGGPAYYIEGALHSKGLAMAFVVFLILTYAVGFNLLCSYNLQSTFAIYEFYNPKTTPIIIGLILAAIVGFCLMGGGKRIIKVASVLVPVMGVLYVLAALIVICFHIKYVPTMFKLIFEDAFNFKAIFGGLSGSCMVYGIKRGLYSNEAGVGSAPNASASANVSHPVKQGLVQVISVFIDTLLLCTATAFMCLGSGILPSAELDGAPYVQHALTTVFGRFGPVFITISMILFAFTTLIGNLYYVDNGLAYLNGKKMPSKKFMRIFYVFATLVVFLGAISKASLAWAIADIFMGFMTLINIPACMRLNATVVKALKDYEEQKKAGKDPVFHAADIGLDPATLDYWKDEPVGEPVSADISDV